MPLEQITAVVLLIDFGPYFGQPLKAALWRRKLWEWNVGWIGLRLAVATSFLVANGAKEVVSDSSLTKASSPYHGRSVKILGQSSKKDFAAFQAVTHRVSFRDCLSSPPARDQADSVCTSLFLWPDIPRPMDVRKAFYRHPIS